MNQLVLLKGSAIVHPLLLFGFIRVSPFYFSSSSTHWLLVVVHSKFRIFVVIDGPTCDSSIVWTICASIRVGSRAVAKVFKSSMSYASVKLSFIFKSRPQIWIAVVNIVDILARSCF